MRPSSVVVAAGAVLAVAFPAQAIAAPSSVTVCPTGPPACDYATIPEGIAAVADGGLVSVAPGTYAGGFTIAKDVRVVGSGAAATDVSGESISIASGFTVVLRALTASGAVDTPQIDNAGDLTMRHAAVASAESFSPRGVGGIDNRGTLALRDTSVKGFGGHVGGIRNSGTATLLRARVHDSSGDVGGIENTGTLTVNASEIVDNFAGFDGAISNSGSLVVRDSDISGNGGQGPGGLDNRDGGKAVIVDTTMLRNLLGGIWNESESSITLRRVTITSWGSGVGSSAGISNRGSAVLDATTLDGSGVLYTTHGPTPPPIDNRGVMTLTGSTVRGSHSTEPGGGIDNHGSLTLRSSTVRDNISDDRGGGIYNAGSLTLRYSTITANTAAVAGGGVFNAGAFSRFQTVIAGNIPDDCNGC